MMPFMPELWLFIGAKIATAALPVQMSDFFDLLDAKPPSDSPAAAQEDAMATHKTAA